MGRTTGPDEASSRSKKGDRGRGPRTTQSRSVLISKACSRLLRHQAVNEGIPITSDGWVRLDHLLAWKALSGRNGVSPPPTIEDILEVVEENEKKRFAVRLTSRDREHRDEEAEKLKEVRDQPETTVEKLMRAGKPQQPEPTSEATLKTTSQSTTEAEVVVDKTQKLGITSKSASVGTEVADLTPPSIPPLPETQSQAETEAENETSKAISYYRSTSPAPPAAEFQIRATQGHSIQKVASDTSLLTPIMLEDPTSIPDTCVHGTFYGAWRQILQSGGLKRMGRNHVHFAGGPSLAEVGITGDGQESDEVVGQSDKVISGMRHDAQMLIYVDLHKCLKDVKERGVEMLWWSSENGVILTEGIELGKVDVAAQEKSHQQDNEAQAKPVAKKDAAKGVGNTAIKSAVETVASASIKDKSQGGGFNHKQSKKVQAETQVHKLVPMEYWKLVVDIKGGNGVIWKQGEGMVKELPEDLLSRGNPKVFRGRGGGRVRGRGR